jgi:ubiquinone/menaquinone biosynthesis C-methylase UbiE
MKQNNFDLVAPIYDGLATLVFGGAIKRSQIALLDQLQDVESALIIGGGTGWILRELLERTPVKHVVYVELSEKMIDKARELIERTHPEWLSRVSFRHGTEQSIEQSDLPFDLIVTNFFLACFNDDNCTQMIQRLSRFMAPDGRWLFVDFQLPLFGPARLAAQALFKVMFTFFNVMSDLESKGPPNYSLGFDPLKLRTLHDRRFYADMIRVKVLARGHEKVKHARAEPRAALGAEG